MIEYKYRVDEDGRPAECASCGYPAPLHSFRLPPHRQDVAHSREQLLCEFCSTSMVSNAFNYPQQHADGVSSRAVAHAFNALVDGLGVDRSRMWPDNRNGEVKP